MFKVLGCSVKNKLYVLNTKESKGQALYKCFSLITITDSAKMKDKHTNLQGTCRKEVRNYIYGDLSLPKKCKAIQ